MELAKTSRKVDIMAGFTIGSVMHQTMRKRLVRRIVAASSRLASIFRSMAPMRI